MKQARIVRRIPIRSVFAPSRIAIEVGDCYWMPDDGRMFSRVYYVQPNNESCRLAVEANPQWRGRLWSGFPCFTDMTIVDPTWRGHIATTAPAPGEERDDDWDDDDRLALVRSVWFRRSEVVRYIGISVGHEGASWRSLVVDEVAREA